MNFYIMQWIGSGVRGGIYGAIDADNPGQLPQISKTGRWQAYKAIPESRFLHADEAKKAIAEQGYYLMAGNVDVSEEDGGLPH